MWFDFQTMTHTSSNILENKRIIYFASADNCACKSFQGDASKKLRNIDILQAKVMSKDGLLVMMDLWSHWQQCQLMWRAFVCRLSRLCLVSNLIFSGSPFGLRGNEGRGGRKLNWKLFIRGLGVGSCWSFLHDNLHLAQQLRLKSCLWDLR